MVLVMSHIQESSPLEKTRSTESMSSSAIKIVAQSSPTDTGCKKFSIANILGFRKQDDFRAFLTKNVEKNQWNSDFVELVEKDESSSSKVEQSDMNFNTKAHQDSVIQRKNDQELNDDQSEHESDKDALNKSENPFKNQFCVPMKSDECGLLSTSMLRPETNIFSIQKWPSVFSNANSGLHPTWRFWQDIALRQPSTNYSNYLSSQGYRFQPYINRQRGMKPTPPETNTTKHIHYSSTKLCIEKNSSNPEDSQNPDKAHPQKQIKTSKEAVDVLDSSDMFALEAILTKSNDFESGQSVKDSPTVEKKNIRRSSSRISNSSSCSCSDSSFPNNNSDDDALTAAMCSKPVEKNDMSNTNFTEPRKKKTRTVFSRNQIFQLESTFDMKRYLSSSERAGLAASLNLTETQIKIWFQNRRNKWKRQVASDVDGIPYATTMPANSFNVNSLQQHSSQRNHRPAILHRGTFNHQTVGNSSAQFPTLSCLGNERHLFQWPGMKLSPNIEMARNIGSAFSYYPRAMMAAAVAAATASGGGLCYGTGEIRNTFSNSNVTNHLRQDHTLKNEQSDNSFSTNGIK